MKTPARHVACSLLVVLGACTKTSGPCVGAGCLDTDSDVVIDTDSDVVIDTDSDVVIDTDDSDVVIDTDSDVVIDTDDTDVVIDSDVVIDTDLMHTDETDVVHTDETDVAVHTDTDTDPGMQTCVGPLSDWAMWGTGTNVLGDFASLETYNAWQCSEDLATATTCPSYASTCEAASGDIYTVVLLHASFTVHYVLFAPDGTLAAFRMGSDYDEYCGGTSNTLWLGSEIVGCQFFDPFGSPPCGAPLTCSSPNP